MAGAASAPTADQLRNALRENSIGKESLFCGLMKIDAVTVLSVRSRTATVMIQLPIPSKEIQSQIENKIHEIATDLDSISDVTIQWQPSASETGVRIEMLPNVKNLVVVSSGKGGVGKSTVATNLAVALADIGADVGLLDADIYGPNAPAMLGLDEQSPNATLESTIVPREAHGVKVMSMGFVVDEDDPVIWRGPLVDDMIKQLFGDVEWGSLDYLFVDLPPGTGDAQFSIIQHTPVTGAIVVTTPQSVSVDDARRGLNQFVQYNIPILGIIENMSGFRCPDCDTVSEIFGVGGGKTLAEEFDVPLLSQLPLDPTAGSVTTEKETEPSGVTLPGIGRLQLPRTRKERTEQNTIPPIAIRESDHEIRTRFHEAASRVAAQIALVASDQ
jgi:ATP-binding protein involved in chromosome partitioning